MSGIEIAGLALGAIPVILEAIKMYGETQEHIRDFKHASKQINLVEAQFRVLKVNFLSECRLLLDMVLLDPRLSQQMVSNPQHRMWQEGFVERQMTELLRDNIDACAIIVSDTTSTLKAMATRLSKLQLLTKDTNNAIQRARASASFVMEKSRFERDLSTLRKRNGDLNLLRAHFSPHETRSQPADSMALGALNQVAYLSEVRNTSSMLYDTLKASWSCSDDSHIRHWVKLCLDCDRETRTDPVTLDLAFSSDIAPQSNGIRPTTWVYVQSDSIVGSDGSFNELVESLQNTSKNTLSKTTNIPGNTSISTPTQQSSTVDLCKVGCVSSHIQTEISSNKCPAKDKYFGYLQTPCRSRCLFFGRATFGDQHISACATSQEERTALEDLIEQSRSARLQILHQYQLALRIARSVLQFHSTPWLPPVWRSKDLSIFGSSITDRSLRTLHVSTKFENPSRAQIAIAKINSPVQAPTPVPPSATGSNEHSKVDACCRRLGPGVYNETLFCLGIVLLEIAHWETFDRMRQGDPDEFYTAHRIVRGPPPLGAKYRKIVERCLRCDFGTGSEDLDDVNLQRAVWSKVVYPLEALVRDISQEA